MRDAFIIFSVGVIPAALLIIVAGFIDQAAKYQRKCDEREKVRGDVRSGRDTLLGGVEASFRDTGEEGLEELL